MAATLRDTIEQLYHQHGPALLAYATSILESRCAAQDVLHQVFLKLLSGRVRMPEEPRPYLFRAVRNVALNYRRAGARDSTLDDATLRFIPPPGMDGAAVELSRALADLPPDQRQMVVLKIWGELTLREAADLLEISPNTAASRYRYALSKLRQRFGAFAKEP
jgi:RNA polymerase sigma-70 factor (ECF subfamily)